MSLLDILESEAPLSRVEEILQNILGASNEVDPESRVEKLLQNLIEVAYEVDPDSRVELLLDNLLGGHNEIAPMSRVEMLIANALGESYDVVPQSRVEELLVLLAEQYAVEYKTVSGSVVSISDALEAPMKSLKVAIDPVQDLSHGNPSPDNICPIEGWTGANVQRTGINIFDKATAVQDAFVSDTNGIETVRTGSVCSGYISVVPNTTYYIKSDQTKGAWGAWYDENKTYISGITGYITSAQDSAKTKTAPSNARYMRLTIAYAGSGSLDTFSVNYPSTDHDYHAYTGQSVNVSWESTAGTVYGGTLDVVSGELVVNRMYTIFDGSEDEIWYTYSNTGYRVPRINIGLSGNGICNIAPTVSSASSYGVMFSASNNYIYFFQTVSRWGVATIADLRAWLATNNVKVCYESATPITYHLTPQEVRTLLGQNNVWADTGDVEVTYLAKKH